MDTRSLNRLPGPSQPHIDDCLHTDDSTDPVVNYNNLRPLINGVIDEILLFHSEYSLAIRALNTVRLSQKAKSLLARAVGKAAWLLSDIEKIRSLLRQHAANTVYLDRVDKSIWALKRLISAAPGCPDIPPVDAIRFPVLLKRYPRVRPVHTQQLNDAVLRFDLVAHAVNIQLSEMLTNVCLLEFMPINQFTSAAAIAASRRVVNCATAIQMDINILVRYRDFLVMFGMEKDKISLLDDKICGLARLLETRTDFANLPEAESIYFPTQFGSVEKRGEGNEQDDGLPQQESSTRNHQSSNA